MEYYTTIRDELNELNFDWENGEIIYQRTKDDPGWTEPEDSRLIQFNDSILDHKFDPGFGSPDCPRFIARDEEAIYFPSQYDGATSVEKVERFFYKYLDYNNYPTPYPRE